MTFARLEILLRKYVEDQINVSELSELKHLITNEANDAVLNEILENLYMDQSLAVQNDFDKQTVFNTISSQIFSNPNFEIDSKKYKKHILFRWISAAAAILILVFLGNYFIFQEPSNTKKVAPLSNLFTDIKAPVSNRATITMADGVIMYLDSVTNGLLATEGNVRLVKLANGKIRYELLDSSLKSFETAYNTVTNPRGSRAINISLSDGTKVWLNAGSSITYPVLFTGETRKVTLKGEGYFEVTQVVNTKGMLQKFTVSAHKTETEVLGTSFNIKAYEDEADVKVTLLEGKVDVLSGINKLRLVPGQQATVQNTSITLDRNVNMDEVMAWKSGSFYFDKADIGTVVRQLARWYDLDIEFREKIPNRVFEGEIQRDLTLSQALRILENNKVNFKIEGRKIIIMP